MRRNQGSSSADKVAKHPHSTRGSGADLQNPVGVDSNANRRKKALGLVPHKNIGKSFGMLSPEDKAALALMKQKGAAVTELSDSSSDSEHEPPPKKKRATTSKEKEKAKTAPVSDAQDETVDGTLPLKKRGGAKPSCANPKVLLIAMSNDERKVAIEALEAMEDNG